jgi:hypothetical protein
MKRFRQRCCVSRSPLGLSSSLTLQPQSDREHMLMLRKHLLLWRDNQWRRPPSKR